MNKLLTLIFIPAFIVSCSGSANKCQNLDTVTEWDETTIVQVKETILQFVDKKDDARRSRVGNTFDGFGKYYEELKKIADRSSDKVPEVASGFNSYKDAMSVNANTLLNLACLEANEKDKYQKMALESDFDKKVQEMSALSKRAYQVLEVVSHSYLLDEMIKGKSGN